MVQKLSENDFKFLVKSFSEWQALEEHFLHHFVEIVNLELINWTHYGKLYVLMEMPLEDF